MAKHQAHQGAQQPHQGGIEGLAHFWDYFPKDCNSQGDRSARRRRSQPLHVATFARQQKAVQALLQAGADPAEFEQGLYDGGRRRALKSGTRDEKMRDRVMRIGW